MTQNLSVYINEIMFVIIGLIILYNAIGTFKNTENPKRVTSALFWLILAFIFIVPNLNVFFGMENRLIPDQVTGALVVVMALLSLFKGIHVNGYTSTDERRNDRLGAKIFIPAAGIGVLSFVIYFVFDRLTKGGLIDAKYHVGSIGSLGIAIVISCIIALIVTRDKLSNGLHEGRRLLDIVGPMSILPQILAALGAIFTAAGVGEFISRVLGDALPENNKLVGVIVYCIGMALFTVIMGNGFAAFAVITAGIGVPFVIAQGGDPVVVGALGLTSGYCGTLITPMAANFNIVPANILEMKDSWGIIKAQLPVALIMLTLHIVLMYILAF